MSVDSRLHANTYTEAANEFLEQIRQHSPAAADCIEQIELLYGTRAAYLAGFALMLLKHREDGGGHHYATSQVDLHAFTYCEEMRDSADAIKLYDDAAVHLLLEIDAPDAL